MPASHQEPVVRQMKGPDTGRQFTLSGTTANEWAPSPFPAMLDQHRRLVMRPGNLKPIGGIFRLRVGQGV